MPDNEMEKMAVSLEKQDWDKLRRIVSTGEASSLSHAIRLAVRAYTPRIPLEEVQT